MTTPEKPETPPTPEPEETPPVTTRLTPTADQARAIDAAVKWFSDPDADQLFLLDGSAGTGKTTTLKFILEALDLKNVAAGAYTGKAARVMQRKGIRQAQTLHSMLYRLVRAEDRNRLYWELNPDSPAATAELTVLDEVSMINYEQAGDLMSLARKVLVLGDTQGQLPPIEGTGAFEERPPDYRLTELNRFAADSDIVQLALAALRGDKLPLMETEQAWVLPWEPDFIDLVATLPPSSDRIAICGKNETRQKINRRARAGNRRFIDTMPQPGEPIICCHNNRDYAIWNGMMGEVVNCEIHQDKHYRMSVALEDGISLSSLKVDPLRFAQNYDDKIRLPFPKKDTCEFDWAYCLTCHKSQGSEWEDVVVFDESRIFRGNANRWLYTALTRASKRITVFV